MILTWFHIFLGLMYVGTGVFLAGLREAYMLRQGVTPEFIAWAGSLYKCYSTFHPMDYLRGWGRGPAAPYPRPKSSRVFTTYHADKWFLIWFWPIVMVVAVIVGFIYLTKFLFSIFLGSIAGSVNNTIAKVAEKFK